MMAYTGANMMSYNRTTMSGLWGFLIKTLFMDLNPQSLLQAYHVLPHPSTQTFRNARDEFASTLNLGHIICVQRYIFYLQA